MEPTVDPNFMQLIVPQILEDATLEIPSIYVKVHGRNLPKYACLQVPTGAMWRVELRRDNGRVWFDKGWKTFVENCAVKNGFYLVFRYEGGSFFQVVIFNTHMSEITYPDDANRRVNLDDPQFVNMKEEDGDDGSSVVILEEWPQGPLQTNGTSVVNQSRDDEVLQPEHLPTSSARDGVLQRARAFQSSHPHFIVIMPPTCHSHVYIPSGARIYSNRRDDDDGLYLNGPNGKPYFIKYCTEGPPMFRLRTDEGWSEFAQENRLQDGDACILELINVTVMAFNVTVYRITKEVSRNDPVEEPNVPEPQTGTVGSEHSDSASLERATSFQHRKPSFTVKYKVSQNTFYALCVPSAHASRYLSNQHTKEVLLHGLAGDTWSVKCHKANLHSQVKLTAGWKTFVVDNDLQEGDTLVFELLSQAPNCYNVTIHRAY